MRTSYIQAEFLFCSYGGSTALGWARCNGPTLCLPCTCFCRSLALLHTHARPPDSHALCEVSEAMILARTVTCTFFRISCTENAARTVTHRDGSLGMLHVLRAGTFGIVFALPVVGDSAEDSTVCAAGEMNYDTCSNY